jgi:4-carboxymuconolactone decarboxylase
MDDEERRAAGMVVRRAVLGTEHVDRATAAATALTEHFQDFITRFAWGEVWTGEELDPHLRSCLTLALLTALGHHEELALHIHGAVRNGVTEAEIAGILLHTAVYAGVPAVNTAFRIAQRALEDEHRETGA